MKVNPYFDFVSKQVARPDQALIIWDVDLAIQDSMDTRTTPEQRDHMWELLERTDGGVLFFTGRTHQSVEKTFGHKYAGVFEHYSVARFGHGHKVTYMAPEIDVVRIGELAVNGIQKNGSINIVAAPEEIRANSGEGKNVRAVFPELKNTSVALVHTINGDPAHLESMRAVLKPVAAEILKQLGMEETHMIKAGGDAVEIVPKSLDPNNQAGLYLSQAEISRITAHGLGKDIATHNFHTLYADRRMIITGDSKPDLDAMLVAHDNYDGVGVYVHNGNPLGAAYERAVKHTIPHHTATWGLVKDTVIRLRENAPITKIMPSNVADVMPGPQTPQA